MYLIGRGGESRDTCPWARDEGAERVFSLSVAGEPVLVILCESVRVPLSNKGFYRFL